MPQTLTGSSSTDPTTSPQIVGPADGDTCSSAPLNNLAFQPLVNFIAWLRANMMPAAGGTFTGPINVPAPIANANPLRKDTLLARSNLPIVGQQVSGSSGNWTLSVNTWTDVPGLAVSFTTTGRPVLLLVQPDGGTTQGWVSSVGGSSFLRFARSGTGLGIFSIQLGTGGQGYPPALLFLDAPAAGTYTYKLQGMAQGGATLTAAYVALAAFEL